MNYPVGTAIDHLRPCVYSALHLGGKHPFSPIYVALFGQKPKNTKCQTEKRLKLKSIQIATTTGGLQLKMHVKAHAIYFCNIEHLFQRTMSLSLSIWVVSKTNKTLVQNRSKLRLFHQEVLRILTKKFDSPPFDGIFCSFMICLLFSV